MAEGKAKGIPRRVAVPLISAVCLLFLAFGLSTSAGDPAGTVQRSSGLETGNFALFNSTTATNGLLSVDPSMHYGGQYGAKASYFGGNAPGAARGQFWIDWHAGDEVWYGGAFFLPAGFASGLSSSVQIVGWQSKAAPNGSKDNSGIWIDPSGRASLFGGIASARSALTSAVAVPEGRWFFLEVRQRLSETNPLNEIYLDGGLAASSTARNYFGHRIPQLRFGIVDATQQQPIDLWFDRVVARRIDPGSSCAFNVNANPAMVPGELRGSDVIEAKHVNGWPVACWRPFSDSSPFNQKLQPGDQLAANSDQVVSNLNSLGPVTDARAAIADTCQDYYKIVYWASDADPVWTIQGGSTVEPYDIDGAQLRMPENARPAGCPGGNSDRHLAVVWNGYEYGMWNVTLDRINHIIYPSSGRKLPVTGDGTNGSCTEARFSCLAGRIRYQELEAGQINHALFATSDHVRTGYSYPALQGSQDNPGLDANWPQNGTRVRLDPSYATDQWLVQFPTWKRGILRALRDYGAYFGDDSGSAFTITGFESGTGYTAYGLADPFETYATAHLGEDIFQSGGIFYFDVSKSVDWSKLQVIDPCVAERTC
jgi:hypothetical protein